MTVIAENHFVLLAIYVKGWVLAPFTKPYCRQYSQIKSENCIQLANTVHVTLDLSMETLKFNAQDIVIHN